MSFLSRLGLRFKAAAMRFAVRSSDPWGYALGRRRDRDARLVGDGSGSSIVQAAVGWIARNFPEAPVRVRIEDDDGELEVDDDEGAKAFLRLLRSPNRFYSGILLWMATLADYWISGNGYWLKVRETETGGRVIALWWIPSTLIAPKWPEDGTEYISHYLYKPATDVEVKLEPEDVVHFRFGFDPDNIRLGKSPVASVIREIFTDEEAASYTATILRNLGVPGIVISPGADDVDLEEEDAQAIKAQFMQQFGGDRRGDPLVVGAKVSVSVLSFSPQQMDLKNLRRVPEERVSAVLGVPAIVAGLGAGLDRSTFANYSEAREAGYEENIIPTQRLLGADLEIQLLPDFADPEDRHVDFDISDVRVLQEDEDKVWARFGEAAAKGIITLADFRRGVGLPVDDELHDVYIRNATLVAIREDDPEATGRAEEEPEEPEPPVPPVPPEEGSLPGALGATVPVEPAPAGGNGNGSGIPQEARP
jgi:HK97 family phage portal protein